MKRGPYRTRPGTIAALIVAFRASPLYRGWSPQWAKRVDRYLDAFSAHNGHMRPSDVRRGDIIRMRDEFAEVPGECANWLKAMRALFGYALDIEEIAVDPTRGVKRLPMANPDGFRTWTEDEIDIFVMHHRPPTVAHLAARLALDTGAARADLVLLGWQNVRNGCIEYRRVKTAKRGGPLITVPILPTLAKALADLPRDRLTFLETRQGRTRSPLSLTGDMQRWVAAAGLPEGLGFHGLRKALGRRLAEAGCSPHEIMAVLGHRSISSAQVYTRAYDRAASAESALERLRNISPGKGVVRRLKKPL